MVEQQIKVSRDSSKIWQQEREREAIAAPNTSKYTKNTFHGALEHELGVKYTEE